MAHFLIEQVWKQFKEIGNNDNISEKDEEEDADEDIVRGKVPQIERTSKLLTKFCGIQSFAHMIKPTHQLWIFVTANWFL